MSSLKQLTNLQKEIEQLRSKMVDIATIYGYTSEECIKVSQELDGVLNKYQFLKKKVKKVSS